MNHFSANQKAEFYGGAIAAFLVLVPFVLLIIALFWGSAQAGLFK